MRHRNENDGALRCCEGILISLAPALVALAVYFFARAFG